MTSKLSLSLLSIGLAACGAEGNRGKGGGTVEPGFDEHGLYVANTDHGSIVRVDLRTRDVKTYETGREPTRIARIEDRVYVTNRADRTVSIFQDDGMQLSPAGTIETGAEPFGVVATADRVYVTASIEGKVIEYDASSLQEIRSWDLAGEPRGLAIHPSGRALYVASTYGGKWTHIDLKTGQARELSLPNVTGFNFVTGIEFDLSRRITGDPAVSPDGELLAIPALYVDRDTIIADDPDSMEVPGSGYGGRFNPSIVTVVVDQDGTPDADAQVPYAVTGFVNDPNTGIFRVASGYPTSIAFTPDRRLALVAVQGADAVLAVDLGQIAETSHGGADAAPGFGRGGIGINFLPLVTVLSGAGPDGIAVLDNDTAYVHALFDHRAQKIDLRRVREVMQPGAGSVVPEQLRTETGIGLGQEVLSDDVARGRRLFFATGNPLMSGDGSAVSCATCHFQGRTDGLTWNFERGLRQTPSLAGKVSRYEPVGWMGDRPTVAEDAMLTSQGLMGGQGLTLSDADDISAFINASREIDNPLRGSTDERLARGAAIFARPEVACISCHQGAAYTNNQIVSMFGIETVKVRPLNGIRATAPYLHDGSAATIRDLLERVRDGSMGNTSSLTDEEMSDLEFFLKSL